MESEKKPVSLSIAYGVQRNNKRKASAPTARPVESSEPEEQYDSIAEAILAKKRKAKLAANPPQESDEDSLSYDELNEEAGLKENYAYDLGSIFDEEESEAPEQDSKSIVDSIRKKLKAKRNG